MPSKIKTLPRGTSREIPFEKLILSPTNVRQVNVEDGIPALADDIHARGLLQGLSVRPFLESSAKPTDYFEVTGGGRRYRALAYNVAHKRLSRKAPIPCIVFEHTNAISATEDSLAENVQRAPLHPLDQFRAFSALKDEGLSEEDIGARFFVSATVVKQRLRLAAVSPTLLDVFAKDEMTLETLMAFTVSSDHARQEQVWEAAQHSGNAHPSYIRRQLAAGAVATADKRAIFVGLDLYEHEGGVILRDLFDEDEGGWLQDVALLDRLVSAKLKEAHDAAAAEGWKWVESATEFPYGHRSRLQLLRGTEAPLSDADQATFDKLEAEYDQLRDDYSEADELEPEIADRVRALEAQLDPFWRPHIIYNPG